MFKNNNKENKNDKILGIDKNIVIVVSCLILLLLILIIYYFSSNKKISYLNNISNYQKKGPKIV